VSVVPHATLFPSDALQPSKGCVSLIGVGNMGAGMARNLLGRGWSVEVHDIDAAKVEDLKRFGDFAQSNRALSAPDLIAIIICVVDAAQTESVLFGKGGVVDSAAPGQFVLLCPTLSPNDVESFAGRLAERGIHLVDAPMSGGPARAQDGSMTLMVACPQPVFDRAAPLLNALASRVFRISEKPGDAARTKLVNNLLAGINLVGAAEAMALAARLGLDATTTLDVISQSSGQSWIGSDRMRRAIAGDLAPRAHMTLLEKDTRLAMEAARGVNFDGPLGASASQTFARASAAGLADMDDAALLEFLSRPQVL
jgi:L-threonate 2-dehydrogenase